MVRVTPVLCSTLPDPVIDHVAGPTWSPRHVTRLCMPRPRDTHDLDAFAQAEGQPRCATPHDDEPLPPNPDSLETWSHVSLGRLMGRVKSSAEANIA